MDNEKKSYMENTHTHKYMPKINVQAVWSILQKETGKGDAKKGRWMRESKEIKVGLVRVWSNSDLEPHREVVRKTRQ